MLWGFLRSALGLVIFCVRVLRFLVEAALAPLGCSACDAPLRRRAAFCAPCAATVVALGPAPVESFPMAGAVFDVPIAFGAFGGALATAIRRFKYDERPDLATPLGELMRAAVRRKAFEADIVVPVPLHPKRLAERGFNQASLLGRSVAAELGAAFRPLALRRIRNTKSQAELERSGRAANVINAFRVANPRELEGKRVVLVDDVATTGATLGACAAALLAAGAQSVTAVVLARVERSI
jgi:ComF family protein